MNRQQAAKEAVNKAGSAEKLARSLLSGKASEGDIRRMTWRILKWMQGNGVPAEYVMRVEEITGVPAHRLHPKVFPRQGSAA